MYSIFLRERPRTFSNLQEASRTLSNFIFLRHMGGGPRTFPGGLNKWQWKRLHEKKAREKEKKLLEQEKQLYQARLRSQIRSKLAGLPDPNSSSDPNGSNYNPMSPREQVKALADRFMKEGAEDLWNKEDGPLRTPTQVPRRNAYSSVSPPLDLRKLVDENRGKSGSLMDFKRGRFPGSRNYSVQARRRFGRNESSESSESESERDLNSDEWRNRLRFGANEGTLSEDYDDSDSDSDDDSVRRKVRRGGSSASLGKYDMKITKRVPLKDIEKEYSFVDQVNVIRKELAQKNLVEKESSNSYEELILSEKRFDESGISLMTVRALSEAGFVQMTRVQEATLSVCLEGKDALVKSRSGTGKSAAFLLPAIETVLKAATSSATQRISPVFVLVLCPTRELASQIAAEANVLLKYHDGVGVQTLVGGTRFKVDQKRLESDPCQIIVATPGRLLDHIENRSGLSVRLMGLKMFIVDEADHLLDLGFRKDVEKIVDCLPRQRQSLLFSATIPKEVRRVSQLVLKRDHAYIDAVGLGCVETPAKIEQSYLVAPHEGHFQIIHHLILKHISQVPDYKVIVFCTTGMVTSLLYLLLREMKMNVREIHSRKPQLYRTRISEEFRESKQLILVTSDVSSRGMNYPDVSLVIQVGIPYDREQYIHRVGRTGRAGKEGEAILLLAPWEEYFIDQLNDLPLEKFPSPILDPDIKLKIGNVMANIDTSVKEAAYHAWLGYYNSIGEIGRDKTTLAELANRFSDSIGLEKPPALFRKTAVKMGLKNIPGIRVRK